jgi:hypothetical protein
VKRLVSRGDVSCGEEKRGLSLRGEHGKLHRRIFKSASSIDSLQIDISSIGIYLQSTYLQSAYIFNRHISSIGIYLQSTYPVVQDVVVRCAGCESSSACTRECFPIPLLHKCGPKSVDKVMRGAVWTVKPHHVYRAELGVYVFGVSWVLCGCVCVWCVVCVGA